MTNQITTAFPETNCNNRAMKGIFFDLGGTLVSYRNVQNITIPLLQEICSRLRIKQDETTIMNAYDSATRQVAGIYAEKAFYLHRTVFRDTCKHFVENLGALSNEDVEAWFSDAYTRDIMDCLVLKEDCIETLSYLKSCGLYLSVVSNADDDMLDPLIKRNGLDPYLNNWMSSEAAKSCKPDRGIFRAALDISGLVPESVLFVGDSPEHDIVGANSLGMCTALIIEKNIEPLYQSGLSTQQPVHTIMSLSELKKIVSP